jgi:hypothetical protein
MSERTFLVLLVCLAGGPKTLNHTDSHVGLVEDHNLDRVLHSHSCHDREAVAARTVRIAEHILREVGRSNLDGDCNRCVGHKGVGEVDHRGLKAGRFEEVIHASPQHRLGIRNHEPQTRFQGENAWALGTGMEAAGVQQDTEQGHIRTLEEVHSVRSSQGALGVDILQEKDQSVVTIGAFCSGRLYHEGLCCLERVPQRDFQVGSDLSAGWTAHTGLLHVQQDLSQNSEIVLSRSLPFC